jgi:glutamate formiminotransferase
MWHGRLLLLLGFAGASVEDPNLVGGGPRASLIAYNVELERGDRFIAKKLQRKRGKTYTCSFIATSPTVFFISSEKW